MIQYHGYRQNLFIQFKRLEIGCVIVCILSYCQGDEDDDEDKNVQEDCLKTLTTDDCIMEPVIFQVLKR